MIDLNDLRRKAAAEIRTAFLDAEPPSLAAMQNEHCPECHGTVARFAGKRWTEITVSDLRGNPSPGFLTDVGVRYYLPAMMLRSLDAESELDCFPDSVVHLLSPAGGKPSKHDAARLTGYSPRQVTAILAFLRYREASEKVQRSEPDWPSDWVDAVPAGRVVSRAIKYWQGQLTGNAA